MAIVYKRTNKAGQKKGKWIVRWKDFETGEWRARTAYTDKLSSLALGEKLEQESATPTYTPSG